MVVCLNVPTPKKPENYFIVFLSIGMEDRKGGCYYVDRKGGMDYVDRKGGLDYVEVAE